MKILSTDLQKDFSAEDGKAYRPRQSVNFIRNTLIPFCHEQNIKITEIISDYRQPRPGDTGDCCHPGEWGYESEIPDDIRQSKAWVKCMNSPIWVRENGGDSENAPGLPYQDTHGFSEWLMTVVGSPEESEEVVLIGLTMDCCVLCTAQELTFRGYRVYMLYEGTDPYSGDDCEKEYLANHSPLTNWAEIITWKELSLKLREHD
ncbi:isochorismatase family protein [Patescibacteria group bacterium]|nr:isochorismatase family protein [Patescibacteria group bacterium]